MNIKLIATISFSILYAFFEFYMSRRERGNRKISGKGDKGSIWLLTFAIGTGYWLSFLIASTRTGRIYHWDTCFAIGSLLVITGLIIRIKSILTLKHQFTYTVTRIEDHELIRSGLYKDIRHPGYLGQLIIFLGISLSLSNWLSVLFMIIPVLAGYIYRINVEEKFMVDQMGQKYNDYKKTTKKLIPKIY
jgi:protein-S-isoprenylcysteine O-methyltransferase Ste14